MSAGDSVGSCWLLSEPVIRFLVEDQWESVVVGCGCRNWLSKLVVGIGCRNRLLESVVVSDVVVVNACCRCHRCLVSL